MEPNEGAYGPGDSFGVDLKIDVEKCVNTVEVYLGFPSDYMIVREFITGDSIINLWVEKPESDDMRKINEEGVVHFSGGIPGGYCGRIPGDPGLSNVLGRLVFQVPSLIVGGDSRPEHLSLDFGDGSRVFVNDGFGTEDRLVKRGASFIFADKGVAPEYDWRGEIREDTIPPEPFVIEIRKDPAIFDGRYHAIFSTNDKQTGVDHFELLEMRPGEELGIAPASGWLDAVLGKRRPAPSWKRAAMPYLLGDQELLSVIRVKAIDKAGNERLVEYVPPAPAGTQPSRLPPLPWLVAILMAGGAVIFLAGWGVIALIRRTRSNKS